MYSNLTVYAENVDRYWSVLTGDKQVPPNSTDSVGFVGLKFQEDMKKLVFNVNVENIENITGVYIYHGDKNQNGTVVLDLMEEAKELGNDDENIVHVTREGLITGTVSVGGVKADDLQGQLKDKSLKDLYKSIADGRIYVTVHTEDFPHGEIRGDSFIPIDRVFPNISDFRWN
jgi:hypothetical protein